MHILILLFFFLFGCTQKSFSFFSYENNPIIHEQNNKIAIQPFIYKSSSTYKMLYVSNTQKGIGIYESSSANGIDWFDPHLINLSNRQNEHDPFFYETNGHKSYYFASSDNSNSSLWVNEITQSNIIKPENAREILVAQERWEGSSLSCPSLIQISNINYLFYAGNGNPNWAIGLAYQDENGKWIRCANNPVIDQGASPDIIKKDGVYFLFFQSPNGLEKMETKRWEGCLTKWTNRQVIPLSLRDPSLMVTDSNDLLLYGTEVTTNPPTIGLAGEKQIPTPQYPIVIIPGMFASWNKEAILHNSVIQQSEWVINPFVSEYDALLKSYKTIGLQLDKTLLLFPYDWRKSVEKSVDDLHLFLNETVWSKSRYQPVQLVGHSLGGVLARVYQSAYKEKRVKKIVTVGSPHLGAVQAYKALISGEIDRNNTLLWLTQKLILYLNMSGLQTEKQIISEFMPVLFDILPSFPFIKDKNGNIVKSSISNKLVASYPLENNSLFSFFGGISIQTPAMFIVSERNPTDILFDINNDGHITATEYNEGDGVVTFESSYSNESSPPHLTHGELVYTKEQIKKILDVTGYSTPLSSLSDGKGTKITPSIMFLLRSPAKLEVSDSHSTYIEQQGLLFITDVQEDAYLTKITGLGEGMYTLNIWLISETTDQWFTFTKTTQTDQQDYYSIIFSPKTGGNVSKIVPTNIMESNTSSSFPSIAPTSNQTLTSSSSLSSKISDNTTPLLTEKKGIKTMIKPLVSGQTYGSSYRNQSVLGSMTSQKAKQKKKSSHNRILILISILFLLICILFWKRKSIILSWRGKYMHQ